MRHVVPLRAVLVLAGAASEPDAPKVPQTVGELWADLDPRRDPLEVEAAAQWAEEGGVYRLVLYTIGTFKGTKARMAAFYGHPEGARRVPGLVQIHGGGQRASCATTWAEAMPASR